MAVKLKFSDKTYLAPYMARMMKVAGSNLLEKVDVIAPIPLYHTRKLRRKYNQAALLAQNLAKITGAQYDPFLLKRVRNTKKQTTLPKNLRMKNMEGAFTVNKKAKGKKILLIDDVMTTGATINAAAVALKDTGAKKVYGLVFARVE
jgi:ComF family protein